MLEWLPGSTELTAGTWGIAELTGLVGGLYAPNRTLPPDVPLAAERVEFVFELWDRRQHALGESPIDAAVWRRCRAAATDMARSGDSLLHGDPAMDLTDLAMTGAGSEEAIRSRCRQLAELAGPIDADRLWLWCCNFAPLMAVSLARRAGKATDIALMRNLAGTR